EEPAKWSKRSEEPGTPMNRKYNILQFIETSGPGGAETVLVNIARHIDRKRFNPSVVLHESRWVHEQLKASKIPTRIVPCQRSWDIGFLRRLVRTCRELQVDLIHSHLYGAGLYACLAGFVLRVPVITTLHNELILPGVSERYMPLKNFLIRRLARRIVLVADFMKADYIEKGKFPPDKMLTIYNGIEFGTPVSADDKANVRTELGMVSTDIVVGHVANFRAPKGHRYLIEAAAAVCRNFSHAKFLLVGDFGDGSIKAEVDKLVSEHKLERNVIMLGFRSDVFRLLKAMDVFVLSSISEGHPLSVVEAMGAGLPVVATNVGGLSEIVADGQTGYLVEPKDSTALAEKIGVLIDNRELRETMGGRGRESATGRFSLDTMMKQYEKLYEEALA
ncbi:MAG: glycosyltransferase, partial [Candidatus Zixiibacteriota bacterium]